MLKGILLNFNWIDILMVCLIVRIIIVGIKSNILIEVLGLLGAVCATFVTLHYYAWFGGWLHKNIFIPEAIQDILAFVVVWLTVYVIFKLIINGWSLIFRIEAQATVNQWGGAVIAAARSLFVCGMTFMFLFLSGNDYIKKISQQSFTGFYLTDFSPRTYRFIYDNFVAKFFPEEQLNEKAFDVGNADSHKKKHEKSKEKDR